MCQELIAFLFYGIRKLYIASTDCAKCGNADFAGWSVCYGATEQRPILSMSSTYSIGLYSSTGTCVYQNTVKAKVKCCA